VDAADLIASRPSRPIELGLRANRRQFWLLVLINAFVGAMVGLERTVLPLLAEAEFGLASARAALSFIATFGIVKALSNLVAGRLGDLYGRRRVLLAGWLAGVPVPLIVIWAPSWDWIIFANVLLGLNQGLAWSTTVVMKIDLVGPERRGLAMGLNEFAGYLAVALTALATGYLAEAYGLRPAPFYLGIGLVAAGLGLSLLFVRETRGHAAREAATEAAAAGPDRSASAPGTDFRPSTARVFARASWGDATLSSASQAGLVNNLNDGMAWGLFPPFFAAAGLSVGQIGVLAFAYPAVWGVMQLWTGALSDRWGRKPLIVAGMALQGAALLGVAALEGYGSWLLMSALLGAGTAMVYPALLAAVGDVAHPSWRGSAVGVYRLWRDSGYAVGALLAGTLSDAFGVRWAITVVAALTVASGGVVAARMPRHPGTLRDLGSSRRGVLP
jgi:MFS family permease